MGKESVVEIPDGSGRFYRYEYDESTGKTLYKGPVGDAPQMSEEEFLAISHTYQHTFTQEEINEAFNTLKKGLEKTKLPSKELGPPDRFANISEFMLMEYIPEVKRYGFKHRLSRNYIFVYKDGTVNIPSRDEPWMKGGFPADASEDWVAK